MKVTIDGTDYVPVTADRITLNGVVYMRLAEQEALTLLDNDGDIWEKVKPDAETGNDVYEAANGSLKGRRYPRQYIEDTWGPVIEQ